MPTPTQPFTAAAVENVLSGKTADGLAHFPYTPSFSKNPRARAAAAELINALTDLLPAYGFEINPSRYTALISKTLAYLSKTGLQSPQDIGNLQFRAHDIASAIAASPERLDDNTGIAGILEAHSQRRAQQTAHGRHAVPDRPDQRPILWASPTADITVTEASHPDHLKEDALALLHCAGSTYTGDALKQHGLKPGESGSEAFLHYWRAIRNKTSRIFTVHVKGAIRYTIEYDPATQDITQISGKLHRAGYTNGRMQATNDVPFDDPQMPDLCTALAGIRDTIPLKAIVGLPPAYRGTVRMPDGTLQAVSPANIGKALSGSITLMPGLPKDLLTLAAENPRLNFCLDQQRDARHVPPILEGWVIVEDFDNARLPTLQRGNVCYYGTALTLPRLEQGRIAAPNLSKLDAPRLRAVSVER